LRLTVFKHKTIKPKTSFSAWLFNCKPHSAKSCYRSSRRCLRCWCYCFPVDYSCNAPAFFMYRRHTRNV